MNPHSQRSLSGMSIWSIPPRCGRPAIRLMPEEVTQEVFILLARKAKSLSPRTVLSGWLYQAARLTTANLIKREIRRQRREQELYMQTLTEPDISLWEQISPLLDDAMGRLGEKDRNAIVLRFFENRTPQEVAAALKLNEVTARKRVSRALEKLRTFFAKRGVVLTTAIIAGTISGNSVQAAPAALANSATAVAIAKGAAASASSLTLIKGTLKIMAWTKVNTVIVAGAGVLLAAGTAMVTVNQIREHASENSWRYANIGSDTIAKLPPEVKILPTKFPNSGNMSQGSGRDSNKFVGIGQPAVNIVWAAYNWPQARVIFANGEPTNRFDFITTLAHGSREGLQQELKNKLGLAGHYETRDMDVVLLEMRNPNAHGLHPPTQEKYSYLNHNRNRVEIKWADEPLSRMGDLLESASKIPIIDETDMTNHYSIDLEWKEDGRDPQHKALQKVLLDQLGLEFVPTNMPVEMLVVEPAK